MPVMRGWDASLTIGDEAPEARIIMLTNLCRGRPGGAAGLSELALGGTY